MSTHLSPKRRQDVLEALRHGTVPSEGLDALATGLGPFEATIQEEIEGVKNGGAKLKAVRGDYGCGKTFFVRWLQEAAKQQGFAVSEVQISERETPLHRLETVYRRLVERLSTPDCRQGALRTVIDGWFYTLEEAVLESGQVSPQDAAGLLAATNVLMEKRLAEVSRQAPMFAACLRAYRTALAEGQHDVAEGLIAWLSGVPQVAAGTKRQAGIKGEIDHFAAISFLRGLLIVLRDSGYSGLILVLDEVETLQRVQSNVRDKALNALRQLMDEVAAGQFPGLYLIITGTTAFFDGPQGVQRLQPLAQRLHVDFLDPRFDNPRAVQIRLPAFDLERLRQVGWKVRDLYAASAASSDRLRAAVDDAYIADFAEAVAGQLGGKVGVAPRLFLKKLVSEILDRVDQFPDFDPRRDHTLKVGPAEMAPAEKAAAGLSVDDIELI